MTQQPTVIRMMNGSKVSPEAAPGGSLITPDRAVGFLNSLRAQVHQNLLVAEDDAIDSVALALATQGNVALLGDPSGGKSSFRDHVHRFVDGVEEEDKAFVPGEPTISSRELIGGEIEQIRRENGEESRLAFVIPGIIQPRHKMVHWEEFTGLNPQAFRSAISVPENKRLETTAGVVEMSDLVLNILSGNPSEKSEGTFKVSTAWGSRVGIAAIMGAFADEEERDAIYDDVEALKENPNADPENITPIMDIDELRALNDYLMATQMDKTSRSHAKLLTFATADVLREDFNIKEADRRFQRQITTNAKGLGGLRSADHVVKPEDIQDAMRMVVTSRLALLKGIVDVDEIENVVKKINSKTLL